MYLYVPSFEERVNDLMGLLPTMPWGHGGAWLVSVVRPATEMSQAYRSRVQTRMKPNRG